MKYVRFQHGDDHAYGRLAGGQVTTLSAAPWYADTVSGKAVPLADVTLLAPLASPRIFGAAYNYRPAVPLPGARSAPTRPVLFMKPGTTVIGPGQAIECPADAENLRFEGELAVVIGKKCRGLTAQNALEAVFGYTIANDVTDWDVLQAEGVWGATVIAKGLDSYCPLGPWIVQDIDPAAALIETRVNGTVRQSGTTARLLFSVRDLLVYISQHVTLLPGDVILSGTPEGSGNFQAGDRFAISIAGLGVLEHTAVEVPKRAMIETMRLGQTHTLLPA